MTPRRLAILPRYLNGEHIWQLVHFGWLRVKVLAEHKSLDRIVRISQHVAEVLS